MNLEATSLNGRLTFDGTTITIRRESRAAQRLVGRGAKTLTLDTITGVEFVPAARFRAGYLQFTVPGALERRPSADNRILDAARDENAITFKLKEQKGFQAIRDAILAAIANR
jgi:hypothetical protein